MVNISKSGNAIKFTFTDSDHYLYGNGEVEVPVNSLSLVIDESNFVTFKKAATNDTFITFNPANSNLSDKAGVIEFYKTNMVGSTGGVSSGDVETMIDASLEDYYDKDEIDAGFGDVEAALSGKADTTAVTEEISAAVSGKADTSTVNQIAADATAAILSVSGDVQDLNDAIDEKEEVIASALTEVANDVTALSGAVADKADTTTVNQIAAQATQAITALSGEVQTKVNTTDFNAYSAATATAINGKQDALEYYSEDAENKSAQIEIENTDLTITSTTTFYSDGFDIGVTSNIDDTQNIGYINGGDAGISMGYDKMTGDDATDAHSYLNVNDNGISAEVYANEETATFEIASTGVTINGDAVATEPYVDAAISGKVDTSAITTAITSGSTDSEIPTAKAVYDATQSGGGGATYSAGRGISIDTANTISFAVPIYSGNSGNFLRPQYNNNSIILVSNMNNASASSVAGGLSCNGQNYSFTYGQYNNATGTTSIAVGTRLDAKNPQEAAFGLWNNSVTGSTASGQTLFSVGNGPNGSNRHNAFEIRKNGDIYIASGNTDIKLQDHLGGGGSVTVDSALDTGSTNPVANSAITTAIDDAKAYYISFATIAQTGIHDADWDGIVAAIDDHRPIYAGYPRSDGGIIYYGVECMNKNVGNTEIVMTTSDNENHYFYTFTKNGSEDYAYTVDTKPYVPEIATAITSGSTDSEIPTAKATYDAIQAQGGGGSSVTVDSALDSGSTNPVANSAITAALDTKISNIGKVNQTWVGQGVTSLMKYYKDNNGGVSLGLYVSSINGKSIIEDNYPNLNQFSLVETSAITTSMTSSSTDAQVPSAKAVYDTLGGLKFVQCTQSEYSAMEQAGTLDANTLYIVSNVVS